MPIEKYNKCKKQNSYQIEDKFFTIITTKKNRQAMNIIKTIRLVQYCFTCLIQQNFTKSLILITQNESYLRFSEKMSGTYLNGSVLKLLFKVSLKHIFSLFSQKSLPDGLILCFPSVLKRRIYLRLQTTCTLRHSILLNPWKSKTSVV